MDPLSAVSGVYTLVEGVVRLGKFVRRVQEDVKNASEDVEGARKHVELLRKELEDVRELRVAAEEEKANPFGFSKESLTKAVTTAEQMLADIEQAFPVTAPPATLSKKFKWALKDRNTVSKLATKLSHTESSLQTILQLEQNRITKQMWSILYQQSSVLCRIEKQQMATHERFDALIFNQHNPRDVSGTVEVDVQEMEPEQDRGVVRLTPKRTRLDRGAFSAQLVLLPYGDSMSYRLSLKLSMFQKMYSADFRVHWPTDVLNLSFERLMRTQNIISSGSDIVQACKSGDFRRVQRIFADGQARPSDVTESKWPLLDYAIEGGNSRIVQLLLDNGADPNLTYDQSDMSPLQSAFLRGRMDIARHLIRKGADLGHIDNDGFSVLSYLWVVEEPLPGSTDFLRLCSAEQFREVNVTDSRGWSPFHRAAAIGTADDIDAFMQLGASLSLRTQWYGWTPLFFAASHDNVETFEALVRHSGPDVYQSLDGDGWNLLHCCVYFGAPKVLRSLLRNGIDIEAKTAPAPMLEDPELAYLELTARDLAIYMGPETYKMYIDALSVTGYDDVLDEWGDIYWDADNTAVIHSSDSTALTAAPVYGAEDVDDQWTILHWASYCGSPKIMKLLLMKGADPKHQHGITTYVPPSLEDLDKAPTAAEYIQGGVHRPFIPPVTPEFGAKDQPLGMLKSSIVEVG